MKYARKPLVATTPGDDQPETPCTGRWDVYDALIDRKGGAELLFARREALSLCADCPIRARCWAENANEEWVQELTQERRPKNEVQAAKAISRHRRDYRERLEVLTELIERGASMSQICGHLVVTRSALWKWCSNNGHLDLWARIPAKRQVNGATRHLNGKTQVA